MGTPVPHPFSDLEDDKWYCLSVDFFQLTDPDQGCSGPYQDSHDCCQIGWVIKKWFEDDRLCKQGPGICYVVIAEPQRVTCAMGGYDTEEECLLHCEW
ncbi:unnamed protein product [marine sediment metagenome]|uniref:Uncharacterized protein n=1 Tax=marine sediment metagenome TaxID=412755 RepID=X1NTZ3_9ZZZZ